MLLWDLTSEAAYQITTFPLLPSMETRCQRLKAWLPSLVTTCEANLEIPLKRSIGDPPHGGPKSEASVARMLSMPVCVGERCPQCHNEASRGRGDAGPGGKHSLKATSPWASSTATRHISPQHWQTCQTNCRHVAEAGRSQQIWPHPCQVQFKPKCQSSNRQRLLGRTCLNRVRTKARDS